MNTYYIKASNAVEIIAGLEEQIRLGGLKPGESLPAIRELAQQIGVSPNTVATAYAKLRDAGLVVSDGRRGTTVALPPSHGDMLTELPAGLIDLASGNVDGNLLPPLNAAWLARQGSLTGYDASGDASCLLDVARHWLTKEHLPSAEMGVFSGTLEAIAIALRLRVTPGARVWVEDPCWPPLLALLASLRIKPVPLPVDAHGCLVPEPDKQVMAMILTLRAHNPTGATLSEERLNAMAALMQQQPHTLFILDGYWGPIADQSLPKLNLPANWLYILSVSKFLGPDLRVAVVSGSAAIVADMRRQQSLGPRWVSLLLQKLAAHLWLESEQNKVLSYAQQSYAARRAALVHGLADLGLDIPITGEGLHVWLPVADEASTLQALAAKGWGVQAGHPFRLQSPPAIRISLGNLTVEEASVLARDIVSSLHRPKRSWI